MWRIKKAVVALYLLLVALYLLLYGSAALALPPRLAANTPSRESITYLGCSGRSDERYLTLDASFVLHKNFIEPAADLEAAFRDAAIQHSYYLSGYLAAQRKAGSTFRLAWSSDQPEVTIRAVSPASYPLDLTIDAVEYPHVILDLGAGATSARPDIESKKVNSAYVAAAIMAGRTRRGDPALRVEYSMKRRVVVCAGKRDQIEHVRLGLPFDPYLAYWSVKPDERRSRSANGHNKTVNPCVNDAFLEFPDPYYLWYFWRLAESGKDDKGIPFNCRDLLQPERDYFYFTADLLPGIATRDQGPVFRLDRLPDGRPLHFSILFGFLDSTRPVLKFDELIAFVCKRGRVELRMLLRHVNAKYPPALHYDDGSEYFGILLFGLQSVLGGTALIEADADQGILRLRGNLRRSGRAVELELFLGETDMLTTRDVKHFKPIMSFLETGDVMIYMGHAGLGENMKLSNLVKHLGLSEGEFGERLKASPDYQLLAYFSCYSYSYFGDDVIARRRAARPGSTTDILTTAMDYGAGAGALGILDYTDRFFAGTRGFHGSTLVDKKYIRSDEFLVVKRFE